jgi:hypothetical protein
MEGEKEACLSIRENSKNFTNFIERQEKKMPMKNLTLKLLSPGIRN